eukprot:1493831-Pyramimonas_sp.AAC.1
MIAMYNSRAVSKFGYLAQLSPISESISKWESWALHKVMRTPPFSLPLDQLLALRQCSKLRPLSLRVQCAAALVRSARVTVTNWKALVGENSECGRACSSHDSVPGRIV